MRQASWDEEGSYLDLGVQNRKQKGDRLGPQRQANGRENGAEYNATDSALGGTSWIDRN